METGFLNRRVREAGSEHAFQVYIPAAYDGLHAWPVILFLHGSGEGGNDGLRQTQIGLPAAIRRDPARYPALAVMPQAPIGGTWLGDASTIARAALDQTLEEFSTDAARVYLAGMSMGGNGAWAMAGANPDRFAALVVVCGFVRGHGEFGAALDGDAATLHARLARCIAALPIWMVHGAADPVVPVSESRRMHEALEAAGATVHYRELPGVGHNSWDAAFADPGMSDWLFAQTRAERS